MKRIGFLLLAVVTVAGFVAHAVHASRQFDEDPSPIYGVKIPAGYRDWQLIAVNQLLFAGKGSDHDHTGVNGGSPVGYKLPSQLLRLFRIHAMGSPNRFKEPRIYFLLGSSAGLT